MQGEQEHSERIFLGWTGHGLVAGECVCVRECVCVSYDVHCNAFNISNVLQ